MLKLRGGIQFSVFTGVGELNDQVGAGLKRMGFALRHGLLVDVDADGALLIVD